MLEPHQRTVLLTALRPPDGFVVDRAIATTFTLDLTALLVAPLAFSLYDELLSRESGRTGREPLEGVDPYAVLKAVREHARRLTVFCQATRIAAPTTYRKLMAYLEDSVVQVAPRDGNGVFHPKLWVLRFLRPADGEVQYRVLCSSRNLTFDRSWDTMLVLEGQLTDRRNAFAENHPLGDLMKALPELAQQPMSNERREGTLQMADELRRVRFDLPEGVEALRFHAFGIDGHGQWPFPRKIDRMLVVSPFLSPEILERLSVPGRGDVLLSRVDQLQAVRAEVLQRFSAAHVLDSGAELEDEEPASLDASASVSGDEVVANGLHAKLYVADDGWDAHVWTGSANATLAAFGLGGGASRKGGNVELLVQLTGKKKLFGVDAVLDGKDGSGGMHPLLATFSPPPQPISPSELECRLESILRKARAELGRGRWVAKVGQETAGSFPLALELRSEPIALPSTVVVTIWPITLPEGRAAVPENPLTGQVADFGPCSFEAMTSFFAFKLRVSESDAVLETVFVLNASLEGAPANRVGRILDGLLDSPAKVLKFVHLLLAGDAMDLLDRDEVSAEDSVVAATLAGTGLEAGLLESLLRALDREPLRIDAVDELVRDLAASVGEQAKFPPEFERIWAPIRAARMAQRERARL